MSDSYEMSETIDRLLSENEELRQMLTNLVAGIKDNVPEDYMDAKFEQAVIDAEDLLSDMDNEDYKDSN